MAFESVQRVPPHVAIRQEIAKHRKSVMVAAAGLGPLLEVLDAYLVTVESRLATLESGLSPDLMAKLMRVIDVGEKEGQLPRLIGVDVGPERCNEI